MVALLSNSSMPAASEVFQETDLEADNGRFCVVERGTQSRRVYTYELEDRALWDGRLSKPILTLATRGAGSILASYAASSFATQVRVDGDEGGFFCFTTPLAGHVTLERGSISARADLDSGLAWRPGPSGRLIVSDANARTNIFFKAAELESALEGLLDEPLRRALEFDSQINWKTGRGASVKRQLDFVMREFREVDGVTGNPAALASMQDMLVSTILSEIAHNYSSDLHRTAADGAVPRYVRRAEEFMRAHGAEPLRMADVAIAAGCSLRTLNSVFKHFRGASPLVRLHAIRLDLAREEIAIGNSGVTVQSIARRYGFTNTARFSAAFRLRFGQTPSDKIRTFSSRSSY